MKKAMAVAVSLLVLSSTALALRAFRAWGRPEGATGMRYELWKDGGGWHLRWTGVGRPHHFSGEIRSPGGEVFITSRFRLEEGDRVWKEGRAVRFDAHAAGGWDGFDFRWRGRELIFDLEIDGRPCLKRVFIGSEGLHPVVDPFAIVRHGRGPRKVPPPPPPRW